jgi:hypothetical protein
MVVNKLSVGLCPHVDPKWTDNVIRRRPTSTVDKILLPERKR